MWNQRASPVSICLAVNWKFYVGTVQGRWRVLQAENSYLRLDRRSQLSVGEADPVESVEPFVLLEVLQSL